MRQLTATISCLALLAASAAAQKPKSVDAAPASAKSGVSSIPPSRTQPRTDVSPKDTYSEWAYWTNLTIQPGASVNLDSSLDYSTTDTVRVTVRSDAGDIANLVMSAYWSIPQVDFYGVADVVAGASFPYNNAGGATFNVYGSQFRLQLTNTGSDPMKLTQVLTFARAH